MRIALSENFNGPCPYLDDRVWITHAFRAPQLDSALYEQLIAEGWRRSGTVFYRNACPSCNLCIPLRIPVDAFTPTKSQRRVARRNADVRVAITQPQYREDLFQLYRAYQRYQHNRDDDETADTFREFLCESPLTSKMMLYYAEERLIGIGWVDVLPESISSVYYAFHPDHAWRSLGTYSVIREVQYAAHRNRRYLHLGFYVPGSRKMAYKGRFRPNELRVRGAWVRNHPTTRQRQPAADCTVDD